MQNVSSGGSGSEHQNRWTWDRPKCKQGKGKAFPDQAIKTYRGTDVQLDSFLTSALDAGEWSTSRPILFTPGKEPLYPFNTRVGESQRRSGCCGWTDKSLTPTRIWTPERPAHSLVAIETTLLRLLHANVWGCQVRNVLAKECRHLVKQAAYTNVTTISHALSVCVGCRTTLARPHILTLCLIAVLQPTMSEREYSRYTWKAYFTSANKAWSRQTYTISLRAGNRLAWCYRRNWKKLMVLYCSEWCRTSDSDYSNVSNVTEVISNKWCSGSYGYRSAINHHPSYFFVCCQISHNSIR